jgi:hypothetical protein
MLGLGRVGSIPPVWAYNPNLARFFLRAALAAFPEIDNYLVDTVN